MPLHTVSAWSVTDGVCQSVTQYNIYIRRHQKGTHQYCVTTVLLQIN